MVVKLIQQQGFAGVADATHPSCAVLDAAWSQWRAKQFASTYTVLPLRYKKQQLQTATILALLELEDRRSITTLFGLSYIS